MNILKVLVIFINFVGFTQEKTHWFGYQDTGEEYYNPTEFFKSKHKSFPELEGLNSKGMPLNGEMASYIEKVGVPVLIGNQGEFGGFLIYILRLLQDLNI